MARKVFYSFHYSRDSWRVGQVRNIGVIEGNRPATDNGWETVKKGGDRSIKDWISRQMNGRTCTVVLIGTHTANRKWINHEIVKSWSDEMGVVGIHIHGLKNEDNEVSDKGRNPFDFIECGKAGLKLSSIVKCYDPGGRSSQERYDWIKTHLSNAVEEAIRIRREH